MKYKSKCGYFYKIVSNKKIRISIEEYNSMKGGTVEKDGKLEESDFEKTGGNYIGIPFINNKFDTDFNIKRMTEKNNTIRQQELDEVKLKVLHKPFYLGSEPVIFFGLRQYARFYYACFNQIFTNNIFFYGLSIEQEPIKSTVVNEKQIESTVVNEKQIESTVVNEKKIKPIKLTILNIPVMNLIELFWGLRNIRTTGTNKKFMNRIYNKLLDYFANKYELLRNVLENRDSLLVMTSLQIGKIRNNNGRPISHGAVNNARLLVEEKYGFDINQIKQALINIDNLIKQKIASGKITYEQGKQLKIKKYEQLSKYLINLGEVTRRTI